MSRLFWSLQCRHPSPPFTCSHVYDLKQHPLLLVALFLPFLPFFCPPSVPCNFAPGPPPGGCFAGPTQGAKLPHPAASRPQPPPEAACLRVVLLARKLANTPPPPLPWLPSLLPGRNLPPYPSPPAICIPHPRVHVWGVKSGPVRLFGRGKPR